MKATTEAGDRVLQGPSSMSRSRIHHQINRFLVLRHEGLAGFVSIGDSLQGAGGSGARRQRGHDFAVSTRSYRALSLLLVQCRKALIVMDGRRGHHAPFRTMRCSVRPAPRAYRSTSWHRTRIGDFCSPARRSEGHGPRKTGGVAYSSRCEPAPGDLQHLEKELRTQYPPITTTTPRPAKKDRKLSDGGSEVYRAGCEGENIRGYIP